MRLQYIWKKITKYIYKLNVISAIITATIL